jgi:signal transduction histidine kinase
LLHLDRAAPDVPAALERVHHLETTIADLLALRTVTGSGRSDAREVAADATRRWRTDHRPVALRSADEAAEVRVSTEALRQALDVLLDNAVRHGAGQITLTVEPYGDAIIVEVADEGRGFRTDSRPGTGLRLVAGIVERAGGSLLIRRRTPHPRVALFLPRSTELPLSSTLPGDRASQPTSNR